MGVELRTTLGKLSGDPQRDNKVMYDYVFQLTEELRYLLDNLDVTNFNDLGLARYENGRMQLYAEKLELRAKELEASFRDADGNLEAKIGVTVSGLRTQITALGDTVAGQGQSISTLEQTASQIQTTVTQQGTAIGSMQSSITQNAGKISAIVTNVGAGGTVSAASIVAAINSAGSSVKISADHIVLSGFVTAEDLAGEGATTINGSNITTGEIRAVNFVAQGSMDGSNYNSFIVSDGSNEIGGIGYQWVPDDGATGDKMWIRTVDNGYYKPAIKIQAAGDISIQSERSGGLVYIRSEYQLTLSSAERLTFFVGDTVWQFRDGGLYKNGTAVL